MSAPGTPARRDRAEIVAAARGWLGTPYLHQARCRGAGCDCLGLVLGVWAEAIGPLPRAVPAYTPDWSEVSRQERLWDAARAYLVAAPLAAPARGDVLLFRMREDAVAKHLGLQSRLPGDPGGAAFLHAWSGRGVVETRLEAGWTRRLVARFAFPERT